MLGGISGHEVEGIGGGEGGDADKGLDRVIGHVPRHRSSVLPELAIIDFQGDGGGPRRDLLRDTHPAQLTGQVGASRNIAQRIGHGAAVGGDDVVLDVGVEGQGRTILVVEGLKATSIGKPARGASAWEVGLDV